MDVEAFIRRWSKLEGGAERANYAMFLTELCALIGVPSPDPAGADVRNNNYVFERAVRPRASDALTAPKRIDLYKRDAFILEAKQSRLPGAKNALPGQLSMLPDEPEQLGRRSASPRWDVMMQNARKQAEGYVFLLDADHAAPPFILTCDVGHCFELYADFTGTGRAYGQFPDRKGYRIYLEDLRKEEVRGLLKTIWTDPHSLDPTKQSARVTREIAARLAAVSKRLEDNGANAEHVAHFLMRCLFTMFAEDTDLLPRGSFRQLLEKSVADPRHFPHRLKQLWRDMDTGAEFSAIIDARVRHFNGGLFSDTMVFELGQEEIGELLAAASADWTQVDPAIFGALLEQALDKEERKRLGAHYTPRSYVQRLVDVTVMEPLRADWEAALTRAQAAKDAGKDADAVEIVRAFHHQLCTTRVLDPACGTGNFLYVTLELMKKLEGEVIQTLSALGERQASLAIAGESVDPHQFLGLELNPRAAAIAELVIWIGYLQWHYRNHESHPAEPILKAFKNINFGNHAGYDAVLTWDGYPLPSVIEKHGKRVETYPNPRRPDWPEAEFIVGNPPFIGGKDLRSRMEPGYAEALWAAHKDMNDSADFVMYWWDRAAEILGRKKSKTRRIGFVTTNSISQPFQRRVMERHLNAKAPISLTFAVPDHPWTKASKDSAAVRISMTVAQAGSREGQLWEVVQESGLDTDEPSLAFKVILGHINSDLSAGVDVTKAAALRANEGLCSPGVKLHGSGFIVTPDEAERLGLGRRPGLEQHVRPYRNGRDLTSRPRGVMVIDLFGLGEAEVRQSYPEIYQHLILSVKPERDLNNRAVYRENWWIFGEPRRELRPALEELVRYVVTIETSKHRTFQFLDTETIPDNMLVVVATDDAAVLAILSSRLHTTWAQILGGWLGYGNDPRYTKSRCFDPFPFPDPDENLKAQLRALGEELDATRKRVQAEHPDLTLTGLYNVLEKIRAGAALTPADEDFRQRGLVLILKELHDQIDAATAQAYGWPVDLTDEEILERLVALNAERAREEAAGHVRWLRPDYQIPRFAKGAKAMTGDLDLGETVVALDKGLPDFPKDPYEAPLAIERLLIAAGRPMDAADLARGFKRGGKRIEQRITQALTTLARYGNIIALDGGRYASRRAA
ncbi:MAG: class I SAM-dependent DNA methyltransferase [Phenylobacterium sp.]|uniref:class I SAM-dependent DNA methyltransferase n=1 Tax=Phenylobacterium sp. TaxID=1871053 RepID=UPI0025ED084A|nr:DNA methyltransferase [Phenylobacterium sp.]MCA6243640.1 class I SAM-dependent DNA methyltransferase [Phenylobacterium sp.]MCA6270928.1 class I SAM-dependent DNA methyltransferase [Phenylobacterium sp.]MCA6277138.1 class I SAM-dependent DNA methyltransferase [Phenylobacterium sp.]MCA6294550.1 class I SAM-dependent DNA methyltransferase [Phenylobacterium sp.]